MATHQELYAMEVVEDMLKDVSTFQKMMSFIYILVIKEHEDQIPHLMEEVFLNILGILLLMVVAQQMSESLSIQDLMVGVGFLRFVQESWLQQVEEES